MKFFNHLFILLNILLLIAGSPSISKEIEKSTNASSALSKPLKSRSIKKKVYRVPGHLIIQKAARHGYKFTTNNKGSQNSCSFTGKHWEIPVGAQCNILGFQSKVKRCELLRKGWVLKNIILKGATTGGRNRLPRNSLSPKFDIRISNFQTNATQSKVVQIHQLTLEGPEGNFNKYEEAFSHCSDPRYIP